MGSFGAETCSDIWSSVQIGLKTYIGNEQGFGTMDKRLRADPPALSHTVADPGGGGHNRCAPP